MSTVPQILGLFGIFGALVYAVGDVFLLAGKARLENYPKLQPHAKILSGAEKMVDFLAGVYSGAGCLVCLQHL